MTKVKSKVVDHTEGRLQEAIAFSRKIGDLSLIKNIQRKRTWEDAKDIEVHIYPDRAPYSFEFGMKNVVQNRVMLYGGIIFHGKHDGFGSGSGPTFSVCLTPTTGWSTHT